jgi:hypothetical protein
MISPRTRTLRKEARKILTRMVRIVENEALVHGYYVSEGIVNPKLAKSNAICGGHTACLLGTAALAAPGGLRGNRWLGLEHQTRRRPALVLALKALDAAAVPVLERIVRRGGANPGGRALAASEVLRGYTDSEQAPLHGYTEEGRLAESYFENVLGRNFGRADTEGGYRTKADTRRKIIALCEDAKAQVKQVS